MKQGDFNLEITVNDRSVFEYQHQGDTFIEGRKGSTFKLTFYNHSSNKVLVVPAVDGLSVLDGKPAGPDSPGLVVQAGSSAMIPGWMVDQTQASQFVFADRESSYARGIDSTTTNTGVIGFLVYGEAKKERVVTHIVNIPYPVTPYAPVLPTGPWMSPTWTSKSPDSQIYGMVNTSVSMDTTPLVGTAIYNSAQSTQRRITKNTDENLGVGWGQSVDFKTTTTTFDKGEKMSQLVVYYDSRRNLERKGIVIEPRTQLQSKPNPFPGIGCKPPAGWRG